MPENLADVLSKRGISSPTPIQAATLPDSLAGRDVLGRGRTGSGKSYAFLLPLVARLLAEKTRTQPKRARSLVLAPTRELANQLSDSLAPLSRAAGLTSAVVFGGVNQNPQARALAGGVDVLIACPGRLLDLVGQGLADLSAVEITVIDEADHMADMGFLPSVRRILQATPPNGQRMLFSATLDAGVATLVKQFLTNPVTHEADSALSPVGEMDHHVLRIDGGDRLQVLAELAAAPGRTIIFTRTKHGARKVARQLRGLGVPSVDLHGNLSQNARNRNMEAFHSGRVETIVATDIAARGIHVDDVSLVVHADPPTEHKAYLHRSGRTARAGQAGTVVTLEQPAQHGDVRTLLRHAKIKPTYTDAAPGAPILTRVAPGERVFVSPDQAMSLSGFEQGQPGRPARSGGGGRGQQQRAGGSGRSRNRRSRRRGAGSSGRNRSSAKTARTGSNGRGNARAGAGHSAADFSRGFRSR